MQSPTIAPEPEVAVQIRLIASAVEYAEEVGIGHFAGIVQQQNFCFVSSVSRVQVPVPAPVLPSGLLP